MLHAAHLELRGLRVLVLVDHVLVEALGHQLLGLRLHPRRHERRQVQARVAVEHQLVVDDLVGDVGRHLAVRQPVPRDLGGLEAEERCDREVGRPPRAGLRVLERQRFLRFRESLEYFTDASSADSASMNRHLVRWISGCRAWRRLGFPRECRTASARRGRVRRAQSRPRGDRAPDRRGMGSRGRRPFTRRRSTVWRPRVRLRLEGDITDAASVRHVLERAAAVHGRVDLVVNAAAPYGGDRSGPFGGGLLSEATPEAFEPWAAAPARAAFTFLSTAGAFLLEQEARRRVIQVTGGSVRRAMPGRGLWAAGSFGVRALTQRRGARVAGARHPRRAADRRRRHRADRRGGARPARRKLLPILVRSRTPSGFWPSRAPGARRTSCRSHRSPSAGFPDGPCRFEAAPGAVSRGCVCGVLRRRGTRDAERRIGPRRSRTAVPRNRVGHDDELRGPERAPRADVGRDRQPSRRPPRRPRASHGGLEGDARGLDRDVAGQAPSLIWR